MLNRNNGISQFMNSLNCYSTSKGHGGVRGGIITNTISWHIYLVSDAYQYCNCTARYLAFLDLRLLVRSRKTNTTASRNLAVFWQYWFWRLGHSCRKLRLFRVVQRVTRLWHQLYHTCRYENSSNPSRYWDRLVPTNEAFIAFPILKRRPVNVLCAWPSGNAQVFLVLRSLDRFHQSTFVFAVYATQFFFYSLCLMILSIII